ncbi:hypothetical protein COW91_00505 [Candidatus Nomurabacteria bacterium CG22_combo_CG10-13_8_21_14_all_32_8]|uniref:Uncharacterized protein n=1 Tax=Candidatus Nomurabacteria bacterium CG22_combo_CG10-13_8_21_14_all_32_8 TaxID=1974732 RepID=A0A2H0CIM2_9BACT|nr:MAG: hypothetical protein COW91_00505 [Candidatus Nomurabacteria bacterium CG22_combo_CG10-13_8_21_14_all_32_8]
MKKLKIKLTERVRTEIVRILFFLFLISGFLGSSFKNPMQNIHIYICIIFFISFALLVFFVLKKIKT